MLRQLSFDTSTSDIHIALFQNDECVEERVIEVQSQSSATARQEACTLLVPAIEQIMGCRSWARQDLDCLTVGTGPGSFTGVRTGVVTARAICQALHLPLYAVSFLESLSLDLEGEFAVAMFSNRGHFYAGQSRRGVLESSYANRAELDEMARASRVLYADEKTRDDLAESEPLNGPGSGGYELRSLPVATNVAVAQGRLAWARLSKVGAICEKLIEVDQNLTCQKEIRLELARLYPYNNVTPTYLRAPSVTLKKTNV